MYICGFKRSRYLNLVKVLTKRTWCLAGPNADPAISVNNPTTVHGINKYIYIYIVPATYWFLVGNKGKFRWGLHKDHIPFFPTGNLYHLGTFKPSLQSSRWPKICSINCIACHKDASIYEVGPQSDTTVRTLLRDNIAIDLHCCSREMWLKENWGT